MTNPDNAARRTDLRLWASHFNGTTRQAFVVGGSYFGGRDSAGRPQSLHGSQAERLADERTNHKDDFFVLETARERLPRPGRANYPEARRAARVRITHAPCFELDLPANSLQSIHPWGGY